MSTMLEQRSVLPHRLACLDNLRYLMVLGVITFHSTSAYVGEAYFVVDPNPGQITRFLNGFLISFIMGVLFFVAGYFVIPSLERKGVAGFIWSKVTRLLIPFLLGVAFVAPINTYIAYAAQQFRGLESPGYWDFWLTYMATIPDFPTARLGGDAFSAYMQFHYHHFWFVAQLSALCVAFALLWSLKRRLLGDRAALIGTEARSNAEVSLAALVCAGLLVLTDSAGGLLSAIPGARPVLTVLGTSPWQLPWAALLFGMGIYAYRKRWYLNGTYPGHLIGWGLLWLVILLSDQLGIRMWWRPLTVVVYIALLSGLTFRFMNHQSRFSQSLTANSYAMFIIHYPIVVLLQYLLLDLGAPAALKFLICAALAILTTWTISNFVIRPFPRAASAGLIVLFAGMSLFLHPAPPAGASESARLVDDGESREPDISAITDDRLQWYDRRLDLTDEQVAALRPVLEALVEGEMAADQQLRETLDGMLDEKQLRKFGRMNRRRR